MISFPGQRVDDEYEIVGIVRDVRYVNLRTPDERMAYIPIEQAVDPIGSVMLHVRSNDLIEMLLPVLRDLARRRVPGGFVTRIASIGQRVDASLVRERVLSTLAAFFGGLALILACIGLYGVAAFAVIRRTREIGIRIAVGAQHSSVIWMMLRDMVTLVITGVVLGTIFAVLAGQYISSQLFGVTPGNPLVLGAAIGLLLIVAFAAAFVPDRRASRIDPVIALRSD